MCVNVEIKINILYIYKIKVLFIVYILNIIIKILKYSFREKVGMGCWLGIK